MKEGYLISIDKELMAIIKNKIQKAGAFWCQPIPSHIFLSAIIAILISKKYGNRPSHKYLPAAKNASYWMWCNPDIVTVLEFIIENNAPLHLWQASIDVTMIDPSSFLISPEGGSL